MSPSTRSVAPFLRTRVWWSLESLSEQKLHLATLDVPIEETARAETSQQL